MQQKSSENGAELVERDRQVLWHPYSSVLQPSPLFAVKRAEGVRIQLQDGRWLLDGMSSWWSAMHGYNHPVLNRALQQQAEQFAHVMFGGLTHEPATRLGEQLVQITPAGLSRVFLCDSGSVSVEVAMKMAAQYWQAKGVQGKHRFLSLKRGYHGDTWAAMSVCDPDTGMHHLFRGMLAQQFFVESPSCRFGDDWNPASIEPLQQTLQQHAHEIAALILEPVVQGTGGMRFYHPQWLAEARRLCDQHGVLLIADEIATGFGRTGKLFGCEWAGISPDILCLGKTLAAGYMTLAATLCTDEIATGICSAEPGLFMHGPTFMANPLACAVASASIDLLQETGWQANVQRIQVGLEGHLSGIADQPGVADVRVLGAIGVIEMQQPVDMNRLQPALVEQGVWVRPFGKLVYLMPPYIMQNDDLQQLCQGTMAAISQQAL